MVHRCLSLRVPGCNCHWILPYIVTDQIKCHTHVREHASRAAAPRMAQAQAAARIQLARSLLIRTHAPYCAMSFNWVPPGGPPPAGMQVSAPTANPMVLTIQQYQQFTHDWQRNSSGLPVPSLQDWMHAQAVFSSVPPPPTAAVELAVQPNLELSGEIAQLRAEVAGLGHTRDAGGQDDLENEAVNEGDRHDVLRPV